MLKVFRLTLVSFAILFLAYPSFAQQDNKGDKSSLVRLLQSKGIITEQEAARILAASNADDRDRALAELLVSKGVISREEYEQTLPARPASTDARLATAAAHIPGTAEAKPPAAETSKPTRAPQAQSEGPMTTMSKLPVKIYGSILFNANYVSHGANTIDIPL